MNTNFETPELTLPELNRQFELLKRENQSAKDRAIKQMQLQIDDLRVEVDELTKFIKQWLEQEA